MAKELEYKLQLQSPEQLQQILASEQVKALLQESYREIPMETTYFDNEDRLFSQLHWTLRHRKEGSDPVLCLKTPADCPHARNEFQVIAPVLNEEGILALISQGAPKELLSYYKQKSVFPICGARFLRRCAMLRFSDGSLAELAADYGELFGAKGTLPILELELELYEGEAEQMIAFTRSLCECFGLREQPYSKFARAKTLR